MEMYLRLKVFLFLKIVFLLFAEGVFGGTTTFDVSPLEASWSASAETYEREPAQDRNTFKNAYTAIYEANVASLEEATLKVPKHMVFTETTVEAKATARTPRSPGWIKALKASKGLKVSVSLLFFLGVLAAGLRGLPSPTPVIGDVGVEAIKARLARVKKLLPAAERLAFAMDSNESLGCLAIVQEAVEIGDGEVPETTDSKRLEDALARALGALRKMHRAAAEQAKEVIQADKMPAGLSPLTERKEGLAGEEEDTGLAIIHTYESFCECFGRLSQRFEGVSRRVLTGKQFKDEQDGGLLLDAALSLESLRATSEFRKHLAETADRLREDALSSLKLRFLKESGIDLKQFEGKAALMRAHLALLKDLKGTGEAPFGQVEFLLVQLDSVVEEAQVSTSVEAARDAIDRAAALEGDAKRLLEKFSAEAQFPPTSAENFGSSLGSVMIDLAEKTLEAAKAADRRLMHILEEVTDKTVQGVQDESGESIAVLSMAIPVLNIDTASAIHLRAAKHLENVRKLAEELKKSTVVADAFGLLQTMNAALRSLGEEESKAQEARLKSRFFATLGKDVDYLASVAKRATKQSRHLSGRETQKYKELEKRFGLAVNKAREASKLLGAAEAAVDLRSLAVSIQDSVFVLDEEDRGRRQ